MDGAQISVIGRQTKLFANSLWLLPKIFEGVHDDTSSLNDVEHAKALRFADDGPAKRRIDFTEKFREIPDYLDYAVNRFEQIGSCLWRSLVFAFESLLESDIGSEEPDHFPHVSRRSAF